MLIKRKLVKLNNLISLETIDKGKLQEFIRFCSVGVLCTAIDAAIFYAVRMVASYQLSLVCGYVISLIVNYLLTVYWTFKVQPNYKNLIGIVSAHLFNLFVVRLGLMYAFVEMMALNDQIAYLPTLLISVVTNFIIIKFVVNKYR